MTDQTSLTPSKENKSQAPVQGKPTTGLMRTAGLVAAFAKQLAGDERAMQFATQVSIMARDNPKLAQVSEESLLKAMIQCVHLDLMPNTQQGFAYIIPYGREAQFQLGYKGLIKLAYRSGMVASMSAELVFPEDTFEVMLGDDRRLVHKPSFDVDRSNWEKATHAYATARLMSGQVVFEILGKDELRKIYNASKASLNGPWSSWPEEMAKKTVLKRLLKYLPQSTKQELMSYFEGGPQFRTNQQGELVEGDKEEYVAPLDEAA